MWSESSQNALVQIVDAWSLCLPDLRLAQALLRGRRIQEERGTFEAPLKELWRIQSANDWASVPATMFQARFRRSLRGHGFGKRLSLAISKAMQEMADNVVQHSGPDEEHPAVGLVGYHVADGWMTYAVADIGRGVLSSLHTNPKWSSLANSAEALRASVCRQASRRIGAPHGDGFSEVHRSLADLSGALRFRSADSSLTLAGQRAARRDTVSSSPYLLGFQLAVTCSLAVDSRTRAL